MNIESIIQQAGQTHIPVWGMIGIVLALFTLYKAYQKIHALPMTACLLCGALALVSNHVTADLKKVELDPATTPAETIQLGEFINTLEGDDYTKAVRYLRAMRVQKDVQDGLVTEAYYDKQYPNHPTFELPTLEYAIADLGASQGFMKYVGKGEDKYPSEWDSLVAFVTGGMAVIMGGIGLVAMLISIEENWFWNKRR